MAEESYWMQCEGCGEWFDRAKGYGPKGKHNACYNRLDAKNTPRHRKMRQKWSGKRGRLRTKVFARHGRKCAHCGSSANLTIDHIKPLIKGGTNALDNLQPLCQSCNSSKGARYEH